MSCVSTPFITGSCRADGVEIVQPPPGETGGVVLRFRAADEATAQQLGWQNGRIPDADVRIVAVDSADNPWRFSGSSDGDGQLTLEDVPTGMYRISVSRLLTEAERSQVAATGTLGFQLLIPSVRLHSGLTWEVEAGASRTRGLVISEWAPFFRDAQGVNSYQPGQYIEIYNNSDTTIYLDGKIIGRGYDDFFDLPTRPCAERAFLRVDPQGIWAAAFEKFPGSGRDYPLAPGTTALIATQAIDHRPFTPDGLDLRHANFEFRGPGDVDNPAVPDMINQGTREGSAFGLIWPGGGMAFIAEPVDPAALPRQPNPANPGIVYLRIPAASILDAIFEINTSLPQNIYCPDVSHPSFNRRPINTADRPRGFTVHRRPLLTLPDGRRILQHTLSNEVDLFFAPPTPGSLPPF
jgi:hypothetical protein